MAWQTVQSSTTNLTHILTNGNDIFVVPGVTASSTTTNPVILGVASGHHIIVDGTVASVGGAVVINANPNTDFGYNIETGLMGSITTSGEGIAVSIFGNGPNFLNYGAITSANTAIRMSGNLLFLASIQNPGRIQGDEFGIVNEGKNSLNITNSGSIFARLVAIDASDSFDLITNTGRITGNVKLGGGGDFYNGTNGLFTGKLYGEAGNDFIIGGRLGETFDGGAGNDTITGGLGRDYLTGGLNSDTFRFFKGHSGVGSKADVITDFDKAGNDRIDISELVGPKLRFMGDDDFTGVRQVRIEDVRGPDVIVEINTGGSLAPDMAIRLQGVTLASMTKTDFIL